MPEPENNGVFVIDKVLHSDHNVDSSIMSESEEGSSLFDIFF